MVVPESLNKMKMGINTMKKRGQLEILVAVIVLAVVLIGGYYVAKTQKGEFFQGEPPQPQYVGDSKTQKVCSTEDINFVPANNRILFLKLEDAIKLGFTYSDNCS